MNGIFAQRRARLLSMKAVREAGPRPLPVQAVARRVTGRSCPGTSGFARSAVTIFPWMHTAA